MKRKPLIRRSGLKKRNEERRARLFRKQFGSKERLDWLKNARCTCGREAVHAHHVKSRGAGGTADDMVPLCARCHGDIHSYGQQTYELENGVDLTTLAALYANAWKMMGGDPDE